MHPTRTGTRPIPQTPAPTRTLSGITPSGSLTLGNYLGALRRFVDGQDSTSGSRDSYYFIADLHALTMPHDPQQQRELTLETAALYFAAGLDPSRCAVFVQSQVRAHVELSYLLESTAYVGELSRMIQFKEKGGRPRTRASLFTYPCLMAADILLYDTHVVPVGSDQSQHVELARDVAARFNQAYGETFVIPRFVPPASAARLGDLADPARKMSKSAPPSATGVIRMLDTPDVIARKIGKAVTDSGNEVHYDPAAKPGVSNLLDITAALVGTTPESVAEQCPSYGVLKRACTEAVVATLEPIRHRYAELVADRSSLLATLADGANQASAQADLVVRRAKHAMGLLC
ncbi:tryptophanyl-tRNA synthetase [Antricoccus suffuscus]|uniref:Tryptophan--tRNA ligase n=1 Tax=Antricoccus suffuscus TaxID=1629062 RepID=A0A2T1A4W3_9ACTN|nr:tryptophan--tRNA ligase [Antricoccus suffuscus]PRZ43645.1 tryptophanyl-tRNA synthetase [Antricoccus suffuscus]